MSNRELANRIVSAFFSDEHLFHMLPTPKKWGQLVDKVERELESAQSSQPTQAEEAPITADVLPCKKHGIKYCGECLPVVARVRR